MIAGGIEIETPLCLAPLAGVTTLPVREFFSQHGASLTHTEMISCAGLIRDNAKTFDMLKVSEHEKPLIVQLFGNDDTLVVEGAEVVLKMGVRFSGFGVNMACPMPKITRNGSGAALMKNPELAAKMVKGLKGLGLPVWVKTRKFENDDDTLRFVEVLAEAGADNVCIHGRTCAQRYEGVADREIVRKAADRFPGLIGASGDVKTSEDIREYLSFGCVEIMLARGIICNPYMFEEFGGHVRTQEGRLAEILKFSYRAEELSGEHKALVLLKRFAGSVLKYSRGSAELRRQAMTADSVYRLREIIRTGAMNYDNRIYTDRDMLKEDNV
ncbi:MAG: tRNA-dihydrouridine synthase family protein [Synergistaceae bacterium]|nr:tRNA-dihydrouridine synthase family protein [Synergistaceae bacterium]